MTIEEIRAGVLMQPDSKIEPVETPEWPSVDGQIFVRALSISKRDEYLKLIHNVAKGDTANLGDVLDTAGVYLAAAAMCTQDGLKLFNEEDITLLAERNWAAMQRVINKAALLNGLGEEARKQTKNA